MSPDDLFALAFGLSAAHLLIGTPVVKYYRGSVGRIPLFGAKLSRCYFCTAFWACLLFASVDWPFPAIVRTLGVALMSGAVAALYSAAHNYLTGSWPMEDGADEGP